VQLLMNQAFGTPLQGVPTGPLELGSSDSESMASSPDDGGFVMVFPDPSTCPVPLSSDNTKVGLTAAKCMESSDVGEDTSSTNSAEQQEQMTRLSEERKVYVRRVSSRMYHRVRSTSTTPSAFPHLFQCILLVGLNLDSGDKKVKVPYIKTKYPLDADVPPHIEHLCFPDAKDWPPPVSNTSSVTGASSIDEQSYSLVITSETGGRRFGYCRRVLPEGSNICLPLAYCIISPFRASGFYYKILAELESRHGQPEWLQAAFIKELYSCQFPAPGQGLRLSTANTSYNTAGPVCSMVTTVVRRPLDSRLEERDLTQLFSALPVPVLLQLFGSLLLERKVILISNSLSRLSSCVEALQSILYPFSWQHTLIPVLPTSLLDICLSPTPYIVGILRGRDASAIPGPIDESLMIDLDEARILQGVGDEASILPTRLRRCLKVALQLVTNTTQPRDASRNVLISEAFVRMFVEVCGHYRNHIVTQQDGLKVFEKESFIKAVTSQSMRLFLEWFTETAMFCAFMESHLEVESDVR
ncbi:hypothetical protein L9F63_015327, partial [Diploptera punctata]